MTNQFDLDQLRIASPCRASWSEMEGDDRSRYCQDCRLHVYNFHAMSRDEITELIQGTEGRLCARLYQRRDGTLITRDCPRGKRNVVIKRFTFTGAFFAASAMMLGAIGRKPKDPDEGAYLTPPAAPAFVEPMRKWPVLGEVVEKIWPERNFVVGAMPMPIVSKSTSGP